MDCCIVVAVAFDAATLTATVLSILAIIVLILLYILQLDSTMGQLAQFKLLLWKNYLLQRRKVLVTCLEIALPTFFALILIFVRMDVQRAVVTNATSWTDFALNEDLGTSNWIFGGPWHIYFTPNSTATRPVMELAVKHLNSLCDGCVSG